MVSDSVVSVTGISGSEENASDAPSGALSFIDKVELGNKLVHGVTGFGDGAEVRNEIHIVTLLHAQTSHGNTE